MFKRIKRITYYPVLITLIFLLSPPVKLFLKQYGGTVRILHIFLISLFLSYVFTPVFRSIAFKFNTVDHPDPRKIHKKPTALLGGVSIYLAFLFTILYNASYSPKLIGLLISGTIIFITGVLDDAKGLSAKLRLFVQIIATLIIIKYGIFMNIMPNNIWGNAAEIFLTVLWVVGIMNSFNFIDGVDGLATGLAAISSGCFLIIAYRTNQPYLAFPAIVIMGGCMGFLPYNFKPASIFLGDAGSTFLGFMLAGLSILGDWSDGDPIVSFSIPILILGILIFDMIYITYTRIKDGKVKNFHEWVAYTGKDHFHHRLINAGFTEKKTVLLLYTINIALGISAIQLEHSDIINALLLLGQASILFFLITVLMKSDNRLRNNE